MMASPSSLPTPSQVRRLNDAATLLAQGKAREALQATRSLAIELPAVGKVRHLLALTLKATGELGAARQAFAAAEQLDPDDAQLLTNHANLLVALGELGAALEKYRRATQTDSVNVETWINYSVALMRADDPQAARDAAVRATEAASRWPAAWHALGSAQRALGDTEAAAASLRIAVSLDPNNPPTRLALGVAERLLGHSHTALEHYQVAENFGMRSPELLDAKASALLDAGDVDTAIALARELCDRHPAYAPGHLLLAEMLWEHSAEAASAIEVLQNSVLGNPADSRLRRNVAELLLAAQRPQEALVHIETLRRQADSAELAALAAEAHWQSADPVGALEALADAPATWRRNVTWRRSQVRVLLAARRPELAAQAAEETLAWAGYDQALLASLSTAWRLLDDPREQWLCHYEGLVCSADLDVDDWIEELREVLLGLHRAHRAPLRQSLRLGSQTSGNLLGRTEPVIAKLRSALQETIVSTLATLPRDEHHPFLTRNSGRTRFAGSWSAKLSSGGQHVNHFHQEGWLSSTFYVQLPPSVTSDSTNGAGCLQFGQPDETLRLSHLKPRLMIRPKVGRLVLFPSYLWHGTVPFTDTVARLTVAFDAHPV
ncbi:MAG: tetratricopeptide repeat protein [Gammaproteobacteria bacterium]|jgi:tetratricopeptide (TPR) repeat protein|nr:tetratricopeptide repeat protein [Gammaproteobacteria bacterium]NBP08504.1 tetratricopeptide repeat protein [Gammaproteobacteria bacterium]NCW21681.1 tetratricopeptide repeat protein [Gammaproteobacteria bacterium]NDA43099.1 tetratricopeptide repeat protein [Gammaproteobacteria bacterium]